jgi:hypothetical protein
MMLALNEVGAMAAKAARGAGIPLGQAEDIARVAIYLAATSGNISAITKALTETAEPVDLLWSSDVLRVKSGPAALIGPIIRDAFAMGYDKAELGTVAHAPFVGACLAQSGAALIWEGCKLTRSDTTVLPASCKAVTIPAADWDIWGGLAALTYVPDTDASRLSGAGAGLNDND